MKTPKKVVLLISSTQGQNIPNYNDTVMKYGAKLVCHVLLALQNRAPFLTVYSVE